MRFKSTFFSIALYIANALPQLSNWDINEKNKCENKVNGVYMCNAKLKEMIGMSHS